MKQIPPIKAVMTAFPHSIEFDEGIGAARERMAAHGIRHLPVVQGGRLVGVITEREIGLALQPELRGSWNEESKVGELCSEEAYVVGLNEPLDRVLQQMARRHVHATLVAKDGRLAGIFTTTDACRCFGGLLRSLFPKGGDDEAA